MTQNLGGALPVATNVKPTLFSPLTTKPAAATTVPAVTFAAEEGDAATLTTSTDSVSGTADALATTGDAQATDGSVVRQRLLARRKARRMERRAARRRGLEGEEEAAAAGATTEQLAAGGEAEEPEAEEGAPEVDTMVEEEAPLPGMDAPDAGADADTAALWDLSAFEGEAAEAAAAEAPALGIEALRLPAAAADDEPLSLSTMGAGVTARPIDRHGINPPSTIAPVTKLSAPLPETLDYSTADNPYDTEAVGDVQVRRKMMMMPTTIRGVVVNRSIDRPTVVLIVPRPF